MNQKRPEDRKNVQICLRVHERTDTSIKNIIKRGDAKTKVEAVEKAVDEYDKK